LLVELSPDLRLRADPTVHLEDVEASLVRAGGKLLGESVLEQREPKRCATSTWTPVPWSNATT
jgi:hypothetical protein